MDVLVIGNNTMDHVFFIKDKLCIGEKFQSRKLNSYPGGQAVNAAYTMAALGLSVHYIGNFGDDENGKKIIKTLLGMGFCLEGSEIIENCSNQTAVILVDELNNERTIVMNKNPRLSINPKNIKPNWIESVKAVYIDGHEIEASLVAAKYASSIGIPVIADLEKIQPSINELYPYINTLFVPKKILHKLTNVFEVFEGLNALKSMGVNHIVATDGRNGAYTIIKGKQIHIPSKSCNVVDTTGAGDAFHGAFVSGTLKGMEFEDSLHFSSMIAAIKCETEGPWASYDRLINWRKDI